MSYILVKWEEPNIGMVKCNTDGTSRGNLGDSSYGFCYRNCTGDLIYVESKPLEITTNIIAEVTAIRR